MADARDPYLTLRSPVLALALHVAGSEEAAVEAARETFEAAGDAPPGPGDAGISDAWVLRVALRAALQARARRLPSVRGGEGPWDALTAEPRAILALFAVEGISPALAAAVLGVGEEEAWSLLVAACDRLPEG